MASRKISTHNRGFTLIELMVVIGLLALVGGFALFVSMDEYRGISFRSERDTLISLLQKARSESVNNICVGTAGVCTNGRPHGLHLGILPGGILTYTLFQGTGWATRDATVDEVTLASSGSAATTTPSLTDIVFSELSATTTPTPLGIRTITMSDQGGKTSAITVGYEGGISWSN
jgi:prepilin-type N-terminal cleavage/methylation domain-containing protein